MFAWKPGKGITLEMYIRNTQVNKKKKIASVMVFCHSNNKVIKVTKTVRVLEHLIPCISCMGGTFRRWSLARGSRSPGASFEVL